MSVAQSGDIVREVGTQLVHVHRVGHDGVVHRFSSLSACRSHSHIRQSKKSARPDHRPQGRCVSAVRPNKRRLRNSLLARPAATSWVCWVPERRRERCRPKPELPPRSTQQQPAGRPRPSLLRVSLGGFDNVFPQLQISDIECLRSKLGTSPVMDGRHRSGEHTTRGPHLEFSRAARDA